MYRKVQGGLDPIMTKDHHTCDGCRCRNDDLCIDLSPMYGLCHKCNTSNVLIVNKKKVLCESCADLV